MDNTCITSSILRTTLRLVTHVSTVILSIASPQVWDTFEVLAAELVKRAIRETRFAVGCQIVVLGTHTAIPWASGAGCEETKSMTGVVLFCGTF